MDLLRSVRVTDPLLLHRFTIKPHHLDDWLELWLGIAAARQRAGFTWHRAFIETDAEPKVSWLYSHPDPDAGEALLAADPASGELAAAAAPHVFGNTRIRTVRPELMTHRDASGERLAIMRRYRIVGDWDEFQALWRRIVVVREQYGFRCLFAVCDVDDEMFTWAFDFDGEWADFAAAQRPYYRDPDRVELRGVFDYMADYSIHPARQLEIPAVSA